MLSEEEKAKIKAEEIYRSELRNEIATAKVEAPKSRVWALVNSAFFLWFLSTIFVGGITLIWTNYQNRVTDARVKSQREIEALVARTTQIDKLNLEIEGRLSQFIVDVEHLVEKHDKGVVYERPYLLKAPFTEKDIRAKWQIMKGPPRNEPTASLIYPEFIDRGIVSLIVELDKLEGEANEATNNLAYPDARSLKRVVVAIQGDDIFQDYGERGQDGFLPIWLRFREKIMRGEWSTMFPYTDCNDSFPFC